MIQRVDEGIDGTVDGGIGERVREGMEEVIDGRDDREIGDGIGDGGERIDVSQSRKGEKSGGTKGMEVLSGTKMHIPAWRHPQTNPIHHLQLYPIKAHHKSHLILLHTALLNNQQRK